ncbi:MAG TPA: choice-of-anchor B family protein [Pyrinomonadaceae bacterium]|nr:choice-of-anchor B family protein [Pyrinomonadaceae bacterium]
MSRRSKFFLAAILGIATLIAWSSSAHEGEHHSPGGNGQPNDQQLVDMTFTPCVNGMAATFPCRNVDLMSLLPLSSVGGGTANDIWGWTDPLTGKEYALLGRSTGVSFVDVSDPAHPIYLGNLPTHTVESLWRGLKVFRNHVFVISEAAGHGMQVFDLTNLRNVTSPPVTFNETAYYDGISSAHTINIDPETGYAYIAGSKPGANRTIGVNTCPGRADGGGGLHVVDIHNPAAPTFAGCIDNDGYTHETQCLIYRGPDTPYRGREICFNSNEDTLTIVDATDKSAPHQLSRTGYAGSGYTHQGWLTDDQRSFLLNDELDEQQQHTPTRTYVWDVSDLDAPFVRGVYNGPTTSIDHNLYVRGRFAVESNYRSGVRFLNVDDAAAGALNEVGFFDVYPVDDQALFNGTWANYPYFASGTIIASGIEQGLFVLRPHIGLPVGIDYTPFYVQQHYRDFLGREPDEAGQAFWNFEIASCGADTNCIADKRINVSAAFFISIEFQQTGYLLHRVQTASFATLPRFQPFLLDLKQIGNGVVVGQSNWEQQLEANKQAFLLQWVQRGDFVAQHPLSQSANDYINGLFANAGVTPTQSEIAAAVAAYGNGGTGGRALALRSVVDSGSVYNQQYNSAFVLMQYFGYLRRNPDDAPDFDLTGYQFWLKKLNDFTLPGEDVRDEHVALSRVQRADMVKSFIVSGEYRGRFGQ